MNNNDFFMKEMINKALKDNANEARINLYFHKSFGIGFIYFDEGIEFNLLFLSMSVSFKKHVNGIFEFNNNWMVM